jgi:hypothetical protein
MAGRLKTYQTSLGFFDQAIAAPSMKAALEAWGADSNLFHQGAARQSDDPDVIAATMAAPGVVLKRPVGSSGPFREQAELPSNLASAATKKNALKAASRKSRKHPGRTGTGAADRKAALAFEKEANRQERKRAKEEAAREKQRARRQQAVDKAQKALDAARHKHEEKAADLKAQSEALEEKTQVEDARWDKEKSKLEAALRRAHG